MRGLLGILSSVNSLVDESRPILPDTRSQMGLPGSYKTEYSITIPHNGRYYNVPTIWGGVQYDPDTQMKEILGRFTWDVLSAPYKYPSYNSPDEAAQAAVMRSGLLGASRGAEADRVINNYLHELFGIK